MGKVVARVIQGQLQKLAEEELPESQGCIDMVFAVRQLMEKSWEPGRGCASFVGCMTQYQGRLCGKS